MKDWWINLSLREKQSVLIGSMAAIIFIAYALIWSPLNNKVETLRKQIQNNQKLLLWMQSADKQLQIIEKKSDKTNTPHTSGSLLSMAQNQINQSPLATQLADLRQIDSDSVQLSFKQVDFDKLIEWLTYAWKDQGLLISQITITASNNPGIVSADFILKSS